MAVLTLISQALFIGEISTLGLYFKNFQDNIPNMTMLPVDMSNSFSQSMG